MRLTGSAAHVSISVEIDGLNEPSSVAHAGKLVLMRPGGGYEEGDRGIVTVHAKESDRTYDVWVSELEPLSFCLSPAS